MVHSTIENCMLGMRTRRDDFRILLIERLRIWAAT